MIKKVICLGLIVMMILVVISGVYGSYVREIEKKRIIQGKSVTIVTYGVYSNNGGLLREFISSAEANTYLASISGSVESRPNYGAPRVGVSRSGGASQTQITQLTINTIEDWRNYFIRTHSVDGGWNVKEIENNKFEVVDSLGRKFVFGFDGKPGYYKEDKFIVLTNDQVNNPVGTASSVNAFVCTGPRTGSERYLDYLITIPGTDKKTSFARIDTVETNKYYITFVEGGNEYRFLLNENTGEIQAKIGNTWEVVKDTNIQTSVMDSFERFRNEGSDKPGNPVEGGQTTSSTDARLPEPPTGISSPLTDTNIRTDLDTSMLNDLGELYSKALDAEEQGNLDLALK